MQDLGGRFCRQNFFSPAIILRVMYEKQTHTFFPRQYIQPISKHIVVQSRKDMGLLITIF